MASVSWRSSRSFRRTRSSARLRLSRSKAFPKVRKRFEMPSCSLLESKCVPLSSRLVFVSTANIGQKLLVGLPILQVFSVSDSNLVYQVFRRDIGIQRR